MKNAQLDRLVRQASSAKGMSITLCAVIRQVDAILLVRPKSHGAVPNNFDFATIPYVKGSSVIEKLRDAVFALTSRNLQEVECLLGVYDRWDKMGLHSKTLAFQVSCDEGPFRIVDHADFVWVDPSSTEDYMIEPEIRDMICNAHFLNVAA